MQRFLLGLVAAVAVGALAVGLVAATRKTAAPASLSSVRQELSVIDGRLAALERSSSSSGSSVKHIQACLPELMNYVNGETANITGTGTAYLSSGQQISRFCSGLLSGPTNGP